MTSKQQYRSVLDCSSLQMHGLPSGGANDVKSPQDRPHTISAGGGAAFTPIVPMAARLAAYMPTADLRTRAIQQVHTALVKSADTTAKLGPQNLLIALGCLHYIMPRFAPLMRDTGRKIVVRVLAWLTKHSMHARKLIGLLMYRMLKGVPLPMLTAAAAM